MIDCHEADVLAAAMSVGSLEPEEERELNSHLSGCQDCRRVAAEYMAAAGLLALAAEPLRPSPELRSRLMRAVYGEAMQAERPPRVPLLHRVLALIPSGRGFSLLAGAAAGVVIGAATVAGVTHSSAPEPSSTLAVTLAGQPLVPGAHGHLDYNRITQEATVTVTGLPAPGQVSAGGSVYELWLIPSSGNPVAAGFLSRSPTGAWTAAVLGDVTRYSTVAATIEPSGGSQTPTGGEVVQGAISTN